MAFRASRFLLLLCCCTATFSDVFSYGVLPPVLPFVLLNTANVNPEHVATYVAVLPAILAAATVFSAPLAGWLSDRSFHRKPLFLLAMVPQFIGILLLFFGTSIARWIAGLVLIGVASAVVWPTTMALILDAVPPDQRRGYLGLTSLGIIIGMLLGPTLGGLAYSHGGNRALWGMVLGVTVADLILRILIVEPRANQSASDAKRGKRTPLIFWSLLRSPRALTALWATFALATALTSFDGSLAIHVNDAFGWDAQSTSLLWIAMVLPGLATPLVGWMVDRYGGARYLTAVGFFISAICFICLRFVTANTTGQKALLCTLLALIGAFLGTLIPLFSSEISRVASETQQQQSQTLDARGVFAQSGGLWWAIYTLGLAVGPLWGGFAQRDASWAVMTLSLGVFCAVTSVPIFLHTGGWLWASHGIPT